MRYALKMKNTNSCFIELSVIALKSTVCPKFKFLYDNLNKSAISNSFTSTSFFLGAVKFSEFFSTLNHFAPKEAGSTSLPTCSVKSAF
jgi:hypothetical protein